MIQALKINELRRDELDVAMHRFCNTNEVMKEASEISLFFTRLSDATDAFSGSRMKLSASEHTKLVEYRDTDRDTAARALYTAIKSCLMRLHPGFNKAAQMLIHVFDKYGSQLYKESYSSETSKINKLCETIDNNPNLLNALTILGLIDWYEELKTAQDDFEESIRARDKFELSQEQDIDIAEARSLVHQAYHNLVKYIEAMASIAQDGEYDEVINKFNNIISEFNIQVARRQSAKVDATEE